MDPGQQQQLGMPQPGMIPPQQPGMMLPPQGQTVAVENLGPAPKIDTGEFPDQIFKLISENSHHGYAIYGYSPNGRKMYILRKECKDTKFPVCKPVPIYGKDNALLPKLIEIAINGGNIYTEIISINQDPTPTDYGYIIYSATPNPTPTFLSNELFHIFNRLREFQPNQTLQGVKDFGAGLKQIFSFGGGRRSRRCFRKGRRTGTKRSGRRGTKRFVRRRK
jgi:hypothetical protein